MLMFKIDESEYLVGSVNLKALSVFLLIKTEAKDKALVLLFISKSRGLSSGIVKILGEDPLVSHNLTGLFSRTVVMSGEALVVSSDMKMVMFKFTLYRHSK